MPPNRDDSSKHKLGTFVGVFAPSVLTILGIILFLRLGFVVGHSGVLQALVVLVIATAVTVVTSMSLSAIATNIRVKKGGPYYIISRTLGPEVGGAIGLVLFLAQAISVTFYCVGFGEAAATMLGWTHESAPLALAATALAVLFAFAWLGSDWASRLQLLVMVILAVSIATFFVGAAPQWSGSRFAQAILGDARELSFWTLFAIFFPAVTGFTQGVAMSGDLRDPGKSIPRGVFWSIAVSTLIYAAMMIVFAGSLPLATLREDFATMRRMATMPWLIDAGILSATLSSGMASFLGAPRILQALAGDRVIKLLSPFAKGVGASENPRRAVLLTLVIALGTLVFAELNVIAPIVSMFFLLSYGLLNYATFYEAYADSPSFRPRFRWFDYRVSLGGAVACGVVMLAINATAGLVSMVLLGLIFLYLRRNAGLNRWADTSRSFRLRVVRRHLRALAIEPEHARDWVPHVLALSDADHRRDKLLQFANWIEGGCGFTTAARVVFGSGAAARKERDSAEAELEEHIRRGGYEAYPLVVLAQSFEIALRVLVQTYGIGPLKANTILLNWLEQTVRTRDADRERRYGESLRAALRLGRHVLVLEAEEGEWEVMLQAHPQERRIDVWWFDDDSSRLLLLMAYLMTRTEPWEEATLRACAVVPEGRTPEEVRASLVELLEEVRIEAEIVLVEGASADAIVRRSADATLAVCPFRVKHGLPCDPFGGLVEELVARLPVTLLGIAAGEVELTAEPDEGQIAEAAAALETAREAESKALRAEQEAEREAARVEREIETLRKQAQAEGDEIDPADLEERIEALRSVARQSIRRAAKARAKADLAHAEAGSSPPGTNGDRDARSSAKDANGTASGPTTRRA